MIQCKTSKEISGMGHSMKRKEDGRFIQGKGNYIDDINKNVEDDKDRELSSFFFSKNDKNIFKDFFQSSRWLCSKEKK